MKRVFPDLQDELRKTPAIERRSRQLNRMMMRSGYQPVLMEMDDRAQLTAGNAMLRKMAKIAHPSDKLEGYRIATSYIETQQFLVEDGLPEAGLEQMKQATPMALQGPRLRLIEGKGVV